MRSKALTVISIICSLNFLSFLNSGAVAVAQEDPVLEPATYLIDEPLLERGIYLMESILACENCHTPKDPDTRQPVEGMAFAGGYLIGDESHTAYAPNITMDVETGIGSWSDEEIITAIRDGLRPDGTIVGPPMPSPGFYATMSDNDAKAIVAYLRAVEPVNNEVPKSVYNFPLPPNYGPKVVSVPDPSKDDPVAYGKYVTESLGHCSACHTPLKDGQLDFSRLSAGGQVFPNLFSYHMTAVSLNITPHPTAGIGEWTDEEIKRAITKGISRDGRELVKAMAFSYYDKINDEDLDAMIAYLRSLPPIQ